jgi:hypothetical protein
LNNNQDSQWSLEQMRASRLYRGFVWAARTFLLTLASQGLLQPVLYYLDAPPAVSSAIAGAGFAVAFPSGIAAMALGLGASPPWGDSRARRRFSSAVVVDLVRPKEKA